MDLMLLLKATLVLAAALVAARLLRQAPAIVRHRYWTCAFVAVLWLPLLGLTLPSFTVAVPADWPVTASLPASEPRETKLAQHRPSQERTRVSHQSGVSSSVERTAFAPVATSRLSLRTAIVSVWAIGTSVAIAALLVSLVRVRRLSRGAEEIVDPAWQAAANAIGARLQYRRRLHVLVSPCIAAPMAGGLCRPAVFLPVGCRSWTADQRDVVLAHEISHLASRDPLRHVLTRLAVAVYWFHPLAWIAARQATAAREEACDAAVLALGTRPSVYARVLLDLAVSMQHQPRLVAALPMVQHSRLEVRLMGILEATRPATRRRAAIPLFVVGFFTIAVAAAQVQLPVVVTHVEPVPVISSPGVVEALVVADSPSIAAVPMVVSQGVAEGDCWRAGSEGSFHGNSSTSQVAGRMVVHEQIGTRGRDGVIKTTLGDLRLCLVAEGVGDRGSAGVPSEWLNVAPRFLMEARRGSLVQQLEGERQAGGGQQITWRVGGRERQFDSAAQQWRDRMLAVLDTTWELSTLRGTVSSLRGEISSIRGEESSLRGEISSLRGEVSSMRGRISSHRGEESSLRGEISSIQGHLSSLRGAISSEQGAISSLYGRRSGLNDTERAGFAEAVRRHEAEISRLEKEIAAYDVDAKLAAVERQIASLDTVRKVAAIEAEIQAFEVEGKVAEIERRIAALDVEGKVVAIERRITALDADRRGRQLEDRRDGEVKQLQSAMAAAR